jgi:hypothetical protein
MIHTNSIENFWRLFKRSVIGSFHNVSVKHLRRYLDDFTYRFNNHETEALFADVVIRLWITSAMQYKALVYSGPSSDNTSS